MSREKTSTPIETQFGRLQTVTGARTFTELAAILGVRPSAVSDAKRRGRMPVAWVDTVCRTHGVSAEWILTGEGPESAWETGERGTTAGGSAEEALRILLRGTPTRLLAEELLRRIGKGAS